MNPSITTTPRPHAVTPPPGRVSGRVIALAILLCQLGSASMVVAAPAPSRTDSSAASGEDALSPTDVTALIERFATDRADLERFHAVTISADRHVRLVTHADEWLDRLRAFDDRHDGAERSVESRIDFILLRNHLERSRSRSLQERDRLDRIVDRLPFLPRIAALEEERRRMVGIDGRTAAQRLHEIAAETEVAIGWLGGASQPADFDAPAALRASRMVATARETLARWFAHHDGFHPEFGWWTRTPHAHAIARLAECERLLREERAGQRGRPDDPLVGNPIGREVLVAELKHEFIAQTPEALIALAEREFAWCEAQSAAAAQQMGFDDWRVALDRVKEGHVAPGEQPAFVADEARRAIRFLDDGELVTIPELARELWRIEMLSAEQQRTLPFAAYGPLHMWVAYPTDSMDHSRKIESMRGNNRHFTRIVVPHELIPGHHLQLFMAQRHAAHRQLFRTPFLVEGWCLHWEMLLHDLGYAEGPEDVMGMLHWRMLRCARIIVSLRFHMGLMEPAEMIDFLVDRVGLERDGATAEVRRYVGEAYGPLYQAAYMLGGLQMRALHHELVGAGRMSQRDFHDAVLRCGSIPIPLIRSSLWASLRTRDGDPVDVPADARPESAHEWDFDRLLGRAPKPSSS